MSTQQSRRLSIASGDQTLEAILQTPSKIAPRGVVVVCHPHPLYGGSMHNNVVDSLCDAALQEDLAALRFNFRGVGASGGNYSGGDAEQDDVLAALAAAADLPAGSTAGWDRVGLAGYSFGASMAARALGRARLMPCVAVLVSPPMSTLAAFLLGNESRFQEQRLLLISGDRDHVCPAADLEKLAQHLRPKPDCVVIEGADHSWLGHEAELRDTVGSFLRWHVASG